MKLLQRLLSNLGKSKDIMRIPPHRLTLRDEGLTLMFGQEEYTEDGFELARANNVKRLILTELVSEDPELYSFLSRWTFLEFLRIIDSDKRSVSSVQLLSNLQELHLEDNGGCELLSSAFPNLQRLTFEWSEKRYDLLNHDTISRLCVMYMKPKAKTWAAKLPSLETLSLFSGNLRSLEPFAASTNLKNLRLSDCRQFEDNRSLAAFQSLEVVQFQGCYKALDFDVFNELPALKKLILQEYKNPPLRSFFRADIDVRGLKS